MTSNSLYFRSNVPELTSHGPPKHHDVLQETVDAEESTEHQETNVDTAGELDSTNSVEKEITVISGTTAMST